jgi:hypothetical protein
MIFSWPWNNMVKFHAYSAQLERIFCGWSGMLEMRVVGIFSQLEVSRREKCFCCFCLQHPIERNRFCGFFQWNFSKFFQVLKNSQNTPKFCYSCVHEARNLSINSGKIHKSPRKLSHTQTPLEMRGKNFLKKLSDFHMQIKFSHHYQAFNSISSYKIRSHQPRRLFYYLKQNKKYIGRTFLCSLTASPKIYTHNTTDCGKECKSSKN